MLIFFSFIDTLATHRTPSLIIYSFKKKKNKEIKRKIKRVIEKNGEYVYGDDKFY
jgi:hypothetical protein